MLLNPSNKPIFTNSVGAFIYQIKVWALIKQADIFLIHDIIRVSLFY